MSDTIAPVDTTPSLVATGLRKSFRGRRVVNDVSFDVMPGEIVGLLGPNGAGKSTSFNMVAGLIRPDGGSVKLGSVELGSLPLYRRAQMGLAYLPQESTVFRGLSVADNFVCVLEASGLRTKDARLQAAEVIEQYELSTVAESLGSQLSGGERRRVEMARALLTKPSVILLDEPFAGVDPIAVAEIQGFITQMLASNIGILLTDHNVRETLRVCHRAYLISEGSILMSGTPEAIVADPQARKAYLGEDFSLA